MLSPSLQRLLTFVLTWWAEQRTINERHVRSSISKSTNSLMSKKTQVRSCLSPLFRSKIVAVSTKKNPAQESAFREHLLRICAVSALCWTPLSKRVPLACGHQVIRPPFIESMQRSDLIHLSRTFILNLPLITALGTPNYGQSYRTELQTEPKKPYIVQVIPDCCST